MNAKKTYLIDTENVGSLWIELLKQKTTKDRIVIFYTDNSPNISYSDMLEIVNHHDAFEAVKCYPGKNALDFQLVSQLGFLIKSAPKCDYIIVSKDAGYDPVCRYWTDEGYSVIRTIQLSEPESSTTTEAVKEEPQHEVVIEETTNVVVSDSNYVLLSEHMIAPEIKDCLTITETLEIIKKCGINNLQKIYTTFVSTFGQQKGLLIYKSIKPHIKKINFL